MTSLVCGQIISSRFDTVTLHERHCVPNSPTTGRFVQPLVLANFKENIKALCHRHFLSNSSVYTMRSLTLWGESTGDRWFPLTTGQWHGKRFHGRRSSWQFLCDGPLTRYVKLRVAHAPGMPGTFSLPSHVSDPDMHHGACVTHVPWCMSGSLTSGFLWSQWRGNVPDIPGACATRNFTCLARGPCP